jgi:hypothetical protein
MAFLRRIIAAQMTAFRNHGPFIDFIRDAWEEVPRTLLARASGDFL